MTRRLLSLLPVAVALACAAPAHASMTQESTFQDDPLLVYGDQATQLRTLDQLQALGVDRIRVSVFWRLVAPAPDGATKPAGFDARNPEAYPRGAWDRYDRLVRAAAFRGIGVNFNVTAPAPNWATGDPGERADLKDVWRPDPREFGEFVFAAATRYSGRVPGIPRVSYWTIWNEPNQGAWLAPQWAPAPGDPSRLIETAPKLYRSLVDAAQGALGFAGHGTDTILIGETAPKGRTDKGPSRPLKPRRFLLRLYCLDDNGQFLRGEAAREQDCPEDDQAQRMRAEHPGLFRITGWAHHPYELTQRPDRHPGDPESYTVANLRELGSVLSRVFRRHGAPIPGGTQRFPLYLTEFGYQTDPPDPAGVTYGVQAAYLNQSEWITARNPAVKTLAQFLLVDDKPGSGKTDVERYGATFQSGLTRLGGRRKPAYAAYRLPVHLRRTSVLRGRALAVWGLVRAGRNGSRQSVRIEVRSGRRGAFRRVRTVRTEPRRGYLSARVRVRRSGALRLAWTDPRSKRTYRSRAVAFTVR